MSKSAATAVRYQDAFAITPSDTARLPYQAHGLYVGGTGDVVVVTLGGNKVEFAGLPAGALIPIEFDRVMDTDTSATLLVGLTVNALPLGTFAATPAVTFDTEVTTAAGASILAVNGDSIVAAIH